MPCPSTLDPIQVQRSTRECLHKVSQLCISFAEHQVARSSTSVEEKGVHSNLTSVFYLHAGVCVMHVRISTVNGYNCGCWNSRLEPARHIPQDIHGCVPKLLYMIIDNPLS